MGQDPGYKNAGHEWEATSAQLHVGVHDLPDPATLVAVPYGIYDVGANTGGASVGPFPLPHVEVPPFQSRCGRIQRPATAVMEVRTGPLRRGDRTRGWRVSPSPRHQTVEPHRAPTLCPHHDELDASFRSPITTTDQPMAAVAQVMKPHGFHGASNFIIRLGFTLGKTTRLP